MKNTVVDLQWNNFLICNVTITGIISFIYTKLSLLCVLTCNILFELSHQSSKTSENLTSNGQIFKGGVESS